MSDDPIAIEPKPLHSDVHASHTPNDATASRRNLVASLLGVVGAAALAACESGDTAADRGEPSSSRDSLSASSHGVWYADTIGELRQATKADGWIALLAGNLVKGDGGGGSFYWSSATATDNGSTILNPGGLGTLAAGWRRLGDTVRHADSIATLRALVGGVDGTMSLLLGSSVRGDGGGGVYYWDSATAADNGGTVLNAASLTAAGWRKLGWRSASFNVKDFGAKGDGSDDTAAVQRAADAIPATGGTLYFPAGTYLVNTALGLTITGKSNVTVRGDGAVVKRGAGGVNFRLGTLTSCSDVLVTGLSFDLNGIQQYGGLNCEGCQRLRIEDCRWFDSAFVVTGFDHYAAVVQGSTDVWFTRNHVHRSKIEFNQNARATISRNTFELSEGSQAIAVAAIGGGNQSCSDYVISHNIISDPEGDGIGIGVESVSTGSKTFVRLHVVDNLLVYTTRSGQNAIACGVPTTGLVTVFDDIVVARNTIHYAAGLVPSGAAIVLYTQTAAQGFRNARIEDNQVIGFQPAAVQFPWHAITLQFFVKGVVRNNRVLPLPGGPGTTRGMSLIDMQECDIESNLVTMATGPGTGFRFSASAGSNRFENNRVLGSPNTPYDVTGNGDFISKRRSTALKVVAPIVIAAHSWQEAVISFPGAVEGDSVVAQPDASPGQAVVWSAYVRPNEVWLRIANPLATDVTTFQRTWRIVVENWG